MKDASILRLRSCLFAFLALGAAFGGGQILLRLDEQRRMHKLPGVGEIGSLPPGVVLANRAGGIFRALAINALWMRATELQDRGEVFELVQLYDWITKLEPRFPMVWAYAAWNHAYNVSVKFPVNRPRLLDPNAPGNQPGERWRWVQRGIKTLRDSGIPLNPRAERLYQDLAWIYSHKIGDNMDDAHFYYKVQLARLMQDALGPPPYRRTLEILNAAPREPQELLADPDVRTLVETDLPNAGLDDPFGDPIDVVTRSTALPEAARAILNNPARKGAVARLDTFLRATHLRETLKLDAKVMLDLMERCGPVDWRLPEAHAIYWSQRAGNLDPDERRRADNTERNIFHALTSLYRSGRLTFAYDPDRPERTRWQTSPHFAFVKKAVDWRKEAAKAEAAASNAGGPPPGRVLREGYLNFLREVVLDFSTHGEEKLSREYYKKLQAEGPEGDPANLTEYEDFLVKRELDRLRNASIQQVTNHVIALLARSLYWASLGDMKQAVGSENRAKLFRRKYNAKGYRHRVPPLRTLYPQAFLIALRRFHDFQIDRLEELYPQQIKKARETLEELRRHLRPRPPMPPPTRGE